MTVGGGGSSSGRSCRACRVVCVLHCDGIDGRGIVMCVRVRVRVGMGVAELCVAHGHELENKHDKDSHEGNALHPVIVGDGTGQTVVR